MKKRIVDNSYLHIAVHAILFILLVLCISNCHKSNIKRVSAEVKSEELRKEIGRLYIERELVCREFIEYERSKLRKRIDSLTIASRKIRSVAPERIFVDKPVVIYKDNPYPKDSGVILSVEEFSKIESYQDSVTRYIVDVERVLRQKDENIASLLTLNELSDKRVDDLGKSVMSLSTKVLEQETLLKKKNRRGNIKAVLGFVVGVFIGRI